MGRLVAIKAALAAPSMIRSLTASLALAVTSAGVNVAGKNVAGLGGIDWRPGYFAAYPHAARRIADLQDDLQDDLQNNSQDDISGRLKTIATPTRLIWGDADPIRPLKVGER